MPSSCSLDLSQTPIKLAHYNINIAPISGVTTSLASFYNSTLISCQAAGYGAQSISFFFDNNYKLQQIGATSFAASTSSGDKSNVRSCYFSNGYSITVWESYGESNATKGIYFQMFDESYNKIGGETHANTTIEGAQTEPSILVLPDDRFLITWTSDKGDGSGPKIYGQFFDPQGNKINNEIQINAPDDVGTQRLSSLSLQGNGTILAVWESNKAGPSGSDIYAQTLSLTGEKIDAPLLVNQNWIGEQTKPQITRLEDGSNMIAWLSDKKDGTGPLIALRLVNANGTLVDNEPYIKVDANWYLEGSFAIANMGRDRVALHYTQISLSGTNYQEIYMQLLDYQGCTVGPQIQVSNHYNECYSWNPSLVKLGSGVILSTWLFQGSSSPVLHGGVFALPDYNTTVLATTTISLDTPYTTAIPTTTQIPTISTTNTPPLDNEGDILKIVVPTITGVALIGFGLTGVWAYCRYKHESASMMPCLEAMLLQASKLLHPTQEEDRQRLTDRDLEMQDATTSIISRPGDTAESYDPFH